MKSFNKKSIIDFTIGIFLFIFAFLNLLQGFGIISFLPKILANILVIEIKSDDDVNEINRGKLKYAKIYFNELNKKQNTEKYYFYFLSQTDYSAFFDKVIKNKQLSYISNLEAELSN